MVAIKATKKGIKYCSINGSTKVELVGTGRLKSCDVTNSLNSCGDVPNYGGRQRHENISSFKTNGFIPEP